MTKKETLEKLDVLLQKANILPTYQPNNNQEYDKWYRDIEDILEQIPSMTKYFRELQNLKFKDNPMQQGFDIAWESNGELTNYNKAIKDSIALIETVIDRVEKLEEDTTQKLINTLDEKLKEKDFSINNLSDKILIVHGHDNLAKEEVARLLEKLKLTPIILHEQPDLGMTIIEKLEYYTKDISYGIVLYTDCDLGKGKKEDDLKPRARQNVIFEHGLLCALIGRKHITTLKKGNVEKPSDIDGSLYKDMDVSGLWKYLLINELKAIGFNVSKDDI